MILVRDIRLPLSAGEPQAFEKALHLARIPRSKAAHLGVAKLSVDARHGQPRLVYTVAVTLKDEGEESAFAGASPCVALRSRTDFSGSPWTLATYMVEGGSSKAFTVIKKMMYAEPQALHALLDKLAKSVTLYLNAQIKAGAQSVMIFDTWGGVLTGRDYQQFSLYYMHKIVDGLLRENEGRRVPVTLFTKGGGQWLEAMAETGCDALGLDWTTDIADARRRVGNKVALQGNMDPSMLYASAPRIEEEVATILAGFGQGEGHVFNLGHGIHQDVDPEHAGVFVEAVHRLSAPYHQ